jgi:hypothetical protein
MNIYKEQHLQNKQDEITDRVRQTMSDIILVSVKQVPREFQAYEDIEDCRRGVYQDYQDRKNPF